MPSYWSSLPGVPSNVPTRSSACSLCTSPITKWYKHDPFATHFRQGEIVMLYESVHTPIDIIFGHGNTASKLASSSSKGPRPAIILGSDRPIRPIAGQPLPPTTLVYLLTSYNEIHTSKLLPTILKDYFAIPVSPHCEAGTSGCHLHISPEWQRDNIWLIASKFQSFGTVAGRWQYVNGRGAGQHDLSFIVAGKHIAMLHTVSQERMDTWAERCCTIEGYIDTCEEVYEVRLI
ncbi:hypothetical protein OH76DRAFT_652158 [Lentinus brumalis]|uniref:Uncharacterized protein n=1 Tax=Lentinus brumalis TaxID=2498619 RepID=A0A371D871_9APHY|nr:hypothetical protein OH76DRAFT_652158 [Polyporus brumalis]